MESSNKISNLYLRASTGKKDDSFIGIKIKNKRIEFYYPETYNLEKDERSSAFKDDVLDILYTIEIAKTLHLERAKIESSLVNESEFSLMSCLWIISDYLANGFYVNRERILKNNQRGRINWKYTMKNQHIISNGNIIYNNFVVEVRNPLDNVMVEIHKYCVKKSLDCIGWIFNLNSITMETKPFNDSTKKLYISTIQNELDKTFDDYKKMRLKHILNVVQGLDSSTDENEFTYGVDNYYYIFEIMINSIFSCQKDLTDFKPKANWFLVKENFKKRPSSKLLPDTILIKNKIAYILDSKYYRFGFTAKIADLPETTSIQKQITYGDYLKKKVKKDEVDDIRSVFILPYNRYSNKFNTREKIHYIGFSMAEWKENGENKHETIYAFLIDTKHVIKYWNKHHHEDDVNNLVTQIENAIQEKEALAKKEIYCK